VFPIRSQTNRVITEREEQEGLVQFGEYIKQKRTEKGISVRDAGEKLGVSGNYISQLERGVKKTSDEMVKKIADVYELDEDTLYRKLGRIPISVLEEIKSNPSLQRAMSLVKTKNIPEDKRREMEEELLKVYAEFLEVHKDTFSE